MISSPRFEFGNMFLNFLDFINFETRQWASLTRDSNSAAEIDEFFGVPTEVFCEAINSDCHCVSHYSRFSVTSSQMALIVDENSLHCDSKTVAICVSLGAFRLLDRRNNESKLPKPPGYRTAGAIGPIIAQGLDNMAPRWGGRSDRTFRDGAQSWQPFSFVEVRL